MPVLAAIFKSRLRAINAGWHKRGIAIQLEHAFCSLESRASREQRKVRTSNDPYDDPGDRLT